VAHFLETGTELAPPLVAEVGRLLLEHLEDHYSLYGRHLGMLTARKHIGWYVRDLPDGEDFRDRMNQLMSCEDQVAAVSVFIQVLGSKMDRLPARTLKARNAEPGVHEEMRPSDNTNEEMRA
jgi:tRNA-dihydrouridine synthase B